MIFDNIKNCELYCGTHDGFRQGFEFIMEYLKSPKPVGKYEIDGERVFASVQEYTPKQDNLFEVHRKYIDIQFIISGREKMLYGNKENFKEKTAYDSQKDVEFLEDSQSSAEMKVSDNMFAVFFPDDAHKPGLYDGCESVRKIVVKIAY